MIRSDKIPHLKEILKKLTDIAGQPSGRQRLNHVGLNTTVFIWDVGIRNNSRRNHLLVMADLATEMGLQVYRMKKNRVSRLVDSVGWKYNTTDKNEELRRIAVWCTEELPK